MSFAVSQYRTNNIDTASPAQIVVKLYDGAVRFMRQASAAIEAKDFAKKGVALSKAHAIVSELQATLNPDHAPELCRELDRLYEYVLYCITEANVHAKLEPLEPAIQVMNQLRIGWEQLAKEGP